MVGLLDPVKYGESFFNLYTFTNHRQLQNDRKLRLKRKNKDRKGGGAAPLEINALEEQAAAQLEKTAVNEQISLCFNLLVSQLELQPNASQFAVFSAIRTTVLEAAIDRSILRDLRHKSTNGWWSCCTLCVSMCSTGNRLDCSCHILPISASEKPSAQGETGNKVQRLDSIASDVESEAEIGVEIDLRKSTITVPLIVGAGLQSLFELISEARHVHPLLCSKALKALFDVIQGQEPESFKSEPEEFINSLYNLLLDLTTMPITAKDTVDGWSAMACSALIGLCIARGDTGRLLKAIAGMLMAPKQVSMQRIEMPMVLGSLQRTVASAALSRPAHLNFHATGLPKNSLIDEFNVAVGGDSLRSPTIPAMASDGTYLYLLLGTCLYKIGTGYNGSYRGHIYSQNEEFTKEKHNWLGFSGGILYYRRNSKRNVDHLHVVNTESLTLTSMNPVNMLPIREGFNYTLFSDKDSLHAICTNRYDNLVVRRVNIGSNVNRTAEKNNSNLPAELMLQLSRKRFRLLGYASFEEETLTPNQVMKIQTIYNTFEPSLMNNDLELLEIVSGKEFALTRANNGKVYYYGKSSALGFKSIGRSPNMKLTELIFSKISIRIIQIALGHDGLHALLLQEDGSVYFAGTARRGEDGDVIKNRRQPKVMKPKKITKLEGQTVVHFACNNGTSAFVTKTGQLIMYGKDTMHCDAQGFVNDLSNQHIQKVALGKAHCVALNAKGQIFTFGLNNKGQCGHTWFQSKTKELVSDDHAQKSQPPPKRDKGYEFSSFCDYDDHNIVQGKCRVCVLCKECTGYNISCVSMLATPVENRIVGGRCACGQGEAGCTKCGLCSACIARQESDIDFKVSFPMKSSHQQQCSKSALLRHKEKKSSQEVGCLGMEETSSSRVSPYPPKQLDLPSTSPVVQVACGLHHTVVLTLSGEVYCFGSNQFGQLGTGDLQPVSGPVRVHVPGNVCQVAAGSNHTVLLTYKGLVYTFGGFEKGQLGRLPQETNPNKNASSLEKSRGSHTGPSSSQSNTIQDLSANCGGNTVIGQILAQRQKYLWNCSPGLVFGVGSTFGKRATWIGANGNQTFIKIDESLITSQMLPNMRVTANKDTIILIPTVPLNFQVITIDRRDGSCKAHSKDQIDFVKMDENLERKIEAKLSNNPKMEVNRNIDKGVLPPAIPSTSANGGSRSSMAKSLNQNYLYDSEELSSGTSYASRLYMHQESLKTLFKSSNTTTTADKCHTKFAFTMDPLFNNLWVYNEAKRSVSCYNILVNELRSLGVQKYSSFRGFLAPEVSLPMTTSDCTISRWHASLNLLICLDVLTTAQDNIPQCFNGMTVKSRESTKGEAKDHQYQCVNRFLNFGGGWGYSSHSVEALRFSADVDLTIYGFAMYGGRGTYSCKLKLFDLGFEGGNREPEGTLICESKVIPFQCAPRSKAHVLLPKPTPIVAGCWYLIWARISGPSSDCGSCGQSSVTTDDQVIFSFRSSKKGNNGTNVNSGQIAGVLYRWTNHETKQTTIQLDIDPVKRVSKDFANGVGKECFTSLVQLLNWSWGAIKGYVREQRDISHQNQVQQSIKHLMHINKACLSLLRKYVNILYPQNTRLEGIGDYKCNTTNRPKAFTDKNTKSNQEPGILDNAGEGKPEIGQPSRNEQHIGLGVGVSVSVTRKPNVEQVDLTECIGNVRAIIIGVFCDNILDSVACEDTQSIINEIYDECHTTFVACFETFYPTAALKWSCLCDLLADIDKGIAHYRLLSAILAGLCLPSVRLRSTFDLFNSGVEHQSVLSPSDNSGMPILSCSESYQYPILVEQMTLRSQQEKKDNVAVISWSFQDVLMRLLDIVANPVRDKIEHIFNRHVPMQATSSKVLQQQRNAVNQGLINNCCHLLARVLAEIVYYATLSTNDRITIPPRNLQSTGSRFVRCDLNRTWNTGKFGPDAIAFTVDRSGIAIVGAMIFSGSGSYEYQLELLYDNWGDLPQLPPHIQRQLHHQQQQHRWETLESISGTYDQSAVQGDMTEIKFSRSVLIKENTRYALRLCTQGARTCSGDRGMPSIRGPCGTMFTFHGCDLSFNGTNVHRGQIPCILYYNTALRQTNGSCKSLSNYRVERSEIVMRETALQIFADINKKCSEILILARNVLAASLSPSDNSSNPSPNIDSEHNITPIEEHMDINWVSSNPRMAEVGGGGISAARDISKRLESFSKGLLETLKFESRSTNPFEIDIEIGSTEIHPNDLMIDESCASLQDFQLHNNKLANSKFNGNERVAAEVVEELIANSQYKALHHHRANESEDDSVKHTILQILEVFNASTANLFRVLLPLVYAHISKLAANHAKSSVQILTLVKDILPHVAALNQLQTTKNQSSNSEEANVLLDTARPFASDNGNLNSGNVSTNALTTTSHHYCLVESEHPYRSPSITCYRVEFPACVQWLTIEFDEQCGTAQVEDCLLISVPVKQVTNIQPCQDRGQEFYNLLDNNVKSSKSKKCNATLITSCYRSPMELCEQEALTDSDWMVVKKFNTSSKWLQNSIILPGNCVEFSFEASSLYVQDPKVNRYGFKCLVVGYDNPLLINSGSNACLLRIEQELAYLAGMCSSTLMKKNLNLPENENLTDLSEIHDTIGTHYSLLSKGLALSEGDLGIQQALEYPLPIGSQSNERQFLKDFISGAPGSSGARLAAWLQPEPRLDPNKCELIPICEPIRYGWPTQLTVSIRDQYGDAVVVPELKVEIKATPTDGIGKSLDSTKSHNNYTSDEYVTKKNTSTRSSINSNVIPRVKYVPTTKEKMCFKAITFMKIYQNYSLEELRYYNPEQNRVTEHLVADDSEDGTFSVIWTPSTVGSYCLTVTVDGIALEEIYRVEVKEGNLPPPNDKNSVQNARIHNKYRKFFTQNTAGLRIRSHPTLQSEQVGIVKLNGVISFIDEIENDDGVWLRLSTESIRQHCTTGWYPTEAWCLQYNQHLSKTLLHPIVESVSPSSDEIVDSDSNSSLLAIRNNSEHSITKQTKPERIPTDLPFQRVERNGDTLSKENHAGINHQELPSKEGSENELCNVSAAISQLEDVPRYSTNPFISNENGFKEVVLAPISTDSRVQVNGSPNTALGSTLVGVVGEGANKLHALQKWWKGDFSSSESNSYKSEHIVHSEPARQQKSKKHSNANVRHQSSQSLKRLSVGEMASVSVREIVRLMSGQESKEHDHDCKSLRQTLQRPESHPIPIPETVGGLKTRSNILLKNSFPSTGDTSPSLAMSSNRASQSDTTQFDISSMRRTSLTAAVDRMAGDCILSTPKHTSREHSRNPIKWQNIECMEQDNEILQLIENNDDVPVITANSKHLKHAGDETELEGIIQQQKDCCRDKKGSGDIMFPSCCSQSTIESIKSSISSSISQGEPDIKSGNIQLADDDLSMDTQQIMPTPSSGAHVPVSVSPDGVFKASQLQESGVSVNSNVWPDMPDNTCPQHSITKPGVIGPIKRAMPPSFAESLRSVFAAFLWHEGIVHDAMASASFLKFHPNIPKEGTTILTRRDHDDIKKRLSREQKVQQRHSVEVANAGSYLNIGLSTLETLSKSGNCSIVNRRNRGAALLNNDNKMKDDCRQINNNMIEHPSQELVTVLPPALRSLVYLWEHICSNCVHIVQTNNCVEQGKQKPPAATEANNTLTVTPRDRTIERKTRDEKKLRKCREDESWCELCQVYLSMPVIYHMRMVHPGCGKAAKGKGYNSVGIYCEGWAGNCGEGGKGASSWFLMCNACRNKYIVTAPKNEAVNRFSGEESSEQQTRREIELLVTDNGVTSTANAEIYTTMRENATFLLELSPHMNNVISDSNIVEGRNLPGTSNSNGIRPSPQHMPVVIEYQNLDFIKANNSNSTQYDNHASSSTSSCGKVNGKHAHITDGRGIVNSQLYTTDHLWLEPETFACLHTFGTDQKEDLPYEIFGANNGCLQRPLSCISYESSDASTTCDSNCAKAVSGIRTATGGLPSRFHRSFSMGQGWGSMQQSILGSAQTRRDESHNLGRIMSSAVPRRNNSITESEGGIVTAAGSGGGSLLICYPSENLRRLVPDFVLTATVPVTASNYINAVGLNGNSDNYDLTPASGDKSNLRSHLHNKKSDNPEIEESINYVNALLQRPIMAFVTQRHDLIKLRNVMKRSLRVATCRTYALQALNWLLRSVTQSVCVHDLMWWFVSSLNIKGSLDGGGASLLDGKLDAFETAVLEHPVAYTQISGSLSRKITESLHKFLQSVADLTLYLPMGSDLQRIAIQCFGMHFRQADQQFLHNSHVFGNISKILSKSDEQLDNNNIEFATIVDHGPPPETGGQVVALSDLNGQFDISVSSRPALAESLIDNSTETFWESDEDDRNKAKVIEVTINKAQYCCRVIAVNIDNSRDIQNKVTGIVFKGGQTPNDLYTIKSLEVDAKTSGWISVKVTPSNYTIFRLEFTGPEHTLRVRQIKLLGLPALFCRSSVSTHNHYELPFPSIPNGVNDLVLKENLKYENAVNIQQQICESETLRVFRLLTGQVFGKLINSECVQQESNRIGKNLEVNNSALLAESLDLREHMVGILFSRSKLSHLQKQVIVHIVHAIRKEACRAREEWDAGNLIGTMKDISPQQNFKIDSSPHDVKTPDVPESSTEEKQPGAIKADTYCFEMLSMVLALSGSAVGRSYLSHQYGMLKDLLSLLHTGSDRVQRQVIALLRRILPEISPSAFAEVVGVAHLPPTDYNIAHQTCSDFDLESVGLLDIFLAVIAKSLQLQVKVKNGGAKLMAGKNPSTVRLCNSLDLSIYLQNPRKSKVNPELEKVTSQDSIYFRERYSLDGGGQSPPAKLTAKNLNQRWFLNGKIPVKQAESIIALIRDLAKGKLGDKWSEITKAAVAEAVLNLARLDETFRSPEYCLKTATLWLALASLCVLDKDHVEKLSSGQWAVPDTRPLCSNHDDGETPALIQCECCGSLCGDCDRFLHLNRKTRSHKRTVCKEEEEAIRVELHESCGRTKLFWLLALTDSRTLKAMVEFRDGNHTLIATTQDAVGRCRFCGVTSNSGLLEIGNICADSQCQEHAANACLKTKPCGHACGGVVNEKKCLPCLEQVCHVREVELAETLNEPKLTQDVDDMCMICFIEALACAPSIQLECGHVFHYHCCKTVLERRWNGPRITFGFSMCPICKADIKHTSLLEILEPINTLKQDVKRKALLRIKYDGLPGESDGRDLTALAMDRYAYYVCFKCQKAYYGGEARCDAEIGEKFNPEELVCGGCSDVARAQMCPKHGTDFLEYKCRYCCSVAVFFCFGTTHFCDTCHDDFQRLTNIPKSKLPQCPVGPKSKQLIGEECPLHVLHPPTGEEFALGCGVCRNAQTF